jgi:hypothetical protein
MTSEEAVDAILDIFKAVWDLTGFSAVYSDKPGTAPVSETIWARATVQHATGGQSSLGNEAGARRFTAEGTVFVQVFSPIGDGRTSGYKAAEIVQNAYRDARHPNVWFRNVRIVEVGDNGAFTQTNVLVTFSYDTVR